MFNKQTTLWQPRQRGADKIISRLYTVSPKDVERFCLRILLLHVKGAFSFSQLREVNGTEYLTFKEAAMHRNLLQNDTEWLRCMREASQSHMPKQLRELFALICVFNSPAKPAELFHQFEDQLIEDFLIQENREAAIQNALREIETTLSLHGLRCQDLQLPVPNPLQEAEVQIQENQRIPQDLITTLNNGQRAAFDEIILAISNEGREKNFFFLDGPGGTGKTYLYNVIIRYLNAQNKCVLTYATTGIAADLLINGRTVHSGFKLPIPLLETSTSSMRIPSPESEKIKRASLIIIDEASMLSGNALRVINNLLKEIMNSQRPFGRKVLLLGGDFRQTAPVIPRASDTVIIESSIKQSNLWRFVTELSLTENMRIEGQQEFNRWLIAIGNGTISDGEEHGNDLIEIPQQMHSLGNIVQDIFRNSLIVDINE